MEEIETANTILLRIRLILGDPDSEFKEKYVVVRNDGESEYGKKHYLCKYFCLDLMHDRHAISAMIAYAYSIQEEDPKLAKDLRKIAKIMEEEMSKLDVAEDNDN